MTLKRFGNIMDKMKERCLFCNKMKEPLFGKINWNSSIQVVFRQYKQILFEITVCPYCRKEYTIEEMYNKATENT